MSPVVKKRSADWPIRTDSITDWANREGAIFTNTEYRGMMGKHRDLTIVSDHVTY